MNHNRCYRETRFLIGYYARKFGFKRIQAFFHVPFTKSFKHMKNKLVRAGVHPLVIHRYPHILAKVNKSWFL